LASNELIKNQNAFIEKIKKYNCSVWTSTPSFAYLFLRHPFFEEAYLPSLKKFLFMGEELPNLTCKKIKMLFPQSNIYNAYGPTEATIVTTLVEITDEIITQNMSLPIGYCRPNAELLIEKANKNEENGELIICGEHVSHGYFKNDKLNDEKFFYSNGKRCFKTGDLAFQKNGLFYFLGRNDEQIKLHGYRIELNEINFAILSISDIEDAVTLPLKRNAEVKKIISFIILNQTAIEVEVIKKLNELLPKKLPYYMVPSEFIIVHEFPYSTSHKIDKNKLLESYMLNNK
jgi:D-alanine--poly(phosphoribitol) ligase subunit 1